MLSFRSFDIIDSLAPLFIVSSSAPLISSTRRRFSSSTNFSLSSPKAPASEEGLCSSGMLRAGACVLWSNLLLLSVAARLGTSTTLSLMFVASCCCCRCCCCCCRWLCCCRLPAWALKMASNSASTKGFGNTSSAPRALK